MSALFLAAARALLDARESQMITRVEWKALEKAVVKAIPPLDEGKDYEGFLEAGSDVGMAAANAALNAADVPYSERPKVRRRQNR